MHQHLSYDEIHWYKLLSITFINKNRDIYSDILKSVVNITKTSIVSRFDQSWCSLVRCMYLIDIFGSGYELGSRK